MQRDIGLNKKITPVICSYFYLTTFITKENMTFNLMCQHMFVHEHSAITVISMLDEALWIIVLMDLVVTYETSICWLCVFEGIASILKKQILIQVTQLSIHMDLFLFLYHSFLKKKSFTKTRIKLIHRIKQKIEPLMLHGSRQIGKKNTVLLPQNIKTVHVSHSSIFLYQEFSEKYIVKICRLNILKIQ